MPILNLSCANCNKSFKKDASQYRAKGGKYCTRKCTAEAKRLNKSEKKLKEEKRIYDQQYRAKNLERIKQNKHNYFKMTYDPIAESLKRKTEEYRKRHREYLSNPKYKEYKKWYDQERRSKLAYGDEWWEVHTALLGLEAEIKKNMTKYEIRLQNQTINKAQRRIRNGTTQRGYA